MLKVYTLTSRAQQGIAHVRGTAREQCVSGGSACVGCQVFQPGISEFEKKTISETYIVHYKNKINVSQIFFFVVINRSSYVQNSSMVRGSISLWYVLLLAY